jgi:hypothetical protein
MCHGLLVLLAATLIGCALPVTTDTNGGGGAAETVDASTGEGTNCGSDPTTGATLCLGLNLCPNIAVNTSVYPACGFQVSGTAIDIECLCGQYLCPLGATTTCAAAATVLAQSNEASVCASQSNGSCTYLAATSSSTSTSTSTSASSTSTCDTTCSSQCVGDPTCIEYCGC